MNLGQLPTTDEVINNFTSCWKPSLISEHVTISNALNRVIKEDIFSKNTLPVVRSAAMDGIGVKYDDFKDGVPDTSMWRKNIDYCLADTGDDFDDAFDTVIPIESINFGGDEKLKIFPKENVRKGQNVRNSGSTMKKGELLLKAGRVITATHLNLLASGGYENIEVIKKPRVVYIPTGDELIPMGTVPKRGENLESNGVMVEAMVNRWGADILRYPIYKDDKTDLNNALDKALNEGDIVVINGGSSKGSEDFSFDTIKKRSTWFNHGVKCFPGYSASLGLIDNKPVINSPGPPTANFTVMNWCLRPLIYKALGITSPMKKMTNAILSEPTKAPLTSDFHLRLQLIFEENKLFAYPLTGGERKIDAMSRCNGLAVIKAGCSYKKGDMINAEWLDN